MNNIITSNQLRGINISGGANVNNFILTNEFSSLALQDNGVYINGSSGTVIRKNLFYQNQMNGINVIGGVFNMFISHNSFISNANNGVFFNSGLAQRNMICSNEFYGLNQDRGIYIANGKYNTVLSNNIHDNQIYGIHLWGAAVSNVIQQNIMIDNASAGILIDGEGVDQTVLVRNTVIGATQNYGIRIVSGDKSVMISNVISGLSFSGIHITNGSWNNLLDSNLVYSNNYAVSGNGILIAGGGSNIIMGGEIYGNGRNIFLSGVVTNTVISNMMLHDAYYQSIAAVNSPYTRVYNNVIRASSLGVGSGFGAIVIQGEGSGNFEITGNNIVSNNTVGLIILNGPDNGLVSLNNIIYNNDNGIWINQGLAQNNNITKNNIIGNGEWAFKNNTTVFTPLTNNWWGTTLAVQISSSISNNGGYSNIIPYRLYGKFNITPGADTDTLPVIASVNSYMTNGTQIKISWTKADNSQGDFVRYSVYRSTNSGFTNLTRADVWTNIYSLTATNVIDEPGIGNFYYRVTCLDDPGPSAGNVYTNESWYSGESMTLIAGAPVLHISKTVDKNAAKPFEDIGYMIFYSNSSPFTAGAGLEIVDVLPFDLVLLTNSAEISNNPHSGTVTVYYSTNLSGVSWFNNNYDNTATVQKIRKIRWILSDPVSPGETGEFKFRVIIR